MLEEEEKEYAWRLEVGVYPGILFGIRSYHEDEKHAIHVLYLPFVELALTIYK